MVVLGLMKSTFFFVFMSICEHRNILCIVVSLV